MPRIFILVSLTLGCLIVFIGCGRSSISSPELYPSNIQSGVPSHYLGGIWEITINPEAKLAETIPLRGSEFHVNVTKYLQPPKPYGLSIKINSFDSTKALVDLDATITHPFPNSNLRGFDVRGILMGAGEVISSQSDSGIVFPAPWGLRLKNADGYTRWWNPSEFTTPGLYGFYPGALGSKGFKPLTTLNPYKYFSDPLSPTDKVPSKVNLSNRGTFSTDMTPPSLTRNYIVQFPFYGGTPVYKFQYAIDASWAPPTGSSSTPKPVDDFPWEANCPEAFHIEVGTKFTNAWYIDDENRGGTIKLQIEVFDWGALENPYGLAGEIENIFVESDTLFDWVVSIPPETAIPGSQPVSGIYNLAIDVLPTGLEHQEILITVVSKNPATYKPPVSGQNYPQNAKLAAYTVIEIPILNSNPADNFIHVDSPNGGEVWDSGGQGEILWTSNGEVGNNVRIDYSIANGDLIEIISSTPNDGSFIWDPLPSINSNKIKVMVQSLENPYIWDESDNYFTIGVVGTLHLLSPNGGEVLPGGGWWDIEWESAGPVEEVKIELSLDSGKTYPMEIIASTPDDGLFTWNPVLYFNTSTARIKISDVKNPSVFDESDLNFSISQYGGKITIIQPNGGEILPAGGSYEIKWTYNAPFSDLRIELSTDSGQTFPTVIVMYTECDGSYIWEPVENIETNKARIRIKTNEIPPMQDTSDADFTISK